MKKFNQFSKKKKFPNLSLIISVSVHVRVYDVGCFVDVLASRSGYCVRKLNVPMITILLAPRWVCR